MSSRLAGRVCIIAGLLLIYQTIAQGAPRGGREQLFAVTVAPGARIFVRVCRPPTDSPARLVVINHGSPPDSSDRPRMQPGRCDQEAAQWFTTRGYVVAFPLRRGYGASGGRWAEATTPMLWVYAMNDTFFGPPIARALYQSFTASGGKADFEQPKSFDGDGHRLFFGSGGSAIWGPLVDNYLSHQLPSGN